MGESFITIHNVILCMTFLDLDLAVTASMEDTEMRDTLKKTAKQQGIDPDNLKPGQVYFSPPVLSEEEEGSQFMPKLHRCDGCRAVAHQLEKHAFPAAEKKKKRGKKLSDSEILDATDHLCNDGFDKNYGVKNVNGRNIFSGEGLEGENEPGMMEAGGKWRARLQNMCKELVGVYDEDGIYEMYINRNGKKLATQLCKSYCKGSEQQKISDEL